MNISIPVSIEENEALVKEAADLGVSRSEIIRQRLFQAKPQTHLDRIAALEARVADLESRPDDNQAILDAVPEIVLVHRRSPEQRGMFGRIKLECPLPEWYAEAECGNWKRSGEGNTEEEARTNALAKLTNAMNKPTTNSRTTWTSDL